MNRESYTRLRRAMRDAGITRKGEPFARVVWECAERIFAAAPTDADPFEVASTAHWLLRVWAADVQTERLKNGRR